MPSLLASLKKLRTYQANPDVLKILSDVESQSDRGAAILMGALVENSLRSSLSFRLGHIEADELFGEYKPLYSFDSKIVLGQAVGLYRSQTAANLKAIKEIRNFFAHATISVNFAVPEVASFVQAMNNSLLPDVERRAELRVSGGDPARGRYLAKCATICMVLLYDVAQQLKGHYEGKEGWEEACAKMDAGLKQMGVDSISLPLP